MAFKPVVIFGFLLLVSFMCWNPCSLNIHHVLIFGVCVCVCVFFLRVDNNEGSSSDTQPIFAMSNDEDNKDDVKIPAVLLFSEEGRILKNAMAALDDTDNRLTVRLATKASGKSGLSAVVLYFH